MAPQRAGLLAILALALVASSGVRAQDMPMYTSVVDYVTKQPNFGTLVAAASAAGLVPTLSDNSLVATLFLPTDEAFASFVAETGTNLTEVLANPAMLTSVLTHHVHAGEAIKMFKQYGYTNLETLNGQKIQVNRNSKHLAVTDASGRKVRCSLTPIKAGNATIYVLDSVLLPDFTPKYTSVVDYLTKQSNFGTLVAAASAANLVPTLSDNSLVATLFLPNDAAFAAFVAETGTNLSAVLANPPVLTSILTHHVFAGRAYTSFKRWGKTTLETLNEQEIVVRRTGNKLQVKDGSGRKVKAALKPIKAGNATIFVLESVLLPNLG